VQTLQCACAFVGVRACVRGWGGAAAAVVTVTSSGTDSDSGAVQSCCGRFSLQYTLLSLDCRSAHTPRVDSRVEDHTPRADSRDQAQPSGSPLGSNRGHPRALSQGHNPRARKTPGPTRIPGVFKTRMFFPWAFRVYPGLTRILGKTDGKLAPHPGDGDSDTDRSHRRRQRARPAIHGKDTTSSTANDVSRCAEMASTVAARQCSTGCQRSESPPATHTGGERIQFGPIPSPYNSLSALCQCVRLSETRCCAQHTCSAICPRVSYPAGYKRT
jgi:hypothetical protein